MTSFVVPAKLAAKLEAIGEILDYKHCQELYAQIMEYGLTGEDPEFAEIAYWNRAVYAALKDDIQRGAEN